MELIQSISSLRVMTDEQIIVEIGRLNGLDPDAQGYILNPNRIEGQFNTTFIKPCYLTSRDAIVPVLEKQTEEVLDHIEALLYYLVDTKYQTEEHINSILLATPRQLCIALLKATGKFKL